MANRQISSQNTILETNYKYWATLTQLKPSVFWHGKQFK